MNSLFIKNTIYHKGGKIIVAKRLLKKKTKLNPVLIFAITFIILLILSFIFIEKHVCPIIEALSEVEARIIGTQGINKGVTEALEDGISYDDLIDIVKDEQGKILLIQANTVDINLLGSDIITLVQKNMDIYKNNVKKIPFGNIMGSKLFANLGPNFKVFIIPLSSIVVDFYSEFEQAGINQTIHRIYMEINAKVQVVIPLSNKTVEITSNVPIAETVIVGEVPKTYINIPDINNKRSFN